MKQDKDKKEVQGKNDSVEATKKNPAAIVVQVLELLQGLSPVEVVRVLNAAAAFYDVTEEVGM